MSKSTLLSSVMSFLDFSQQHKHFTSLNSSQREKQKGILVVNWSWFTFVNEDDLDWVTSYAVLVRLSVLMSKVFCFHSPLVIVVVLVCEEGMLVLVLHSCA